MVGMRDVAKTAGVSLSTVSLVVNNTGYVSDDMRAKVEAAMRPQSVPQSHQHHRCDYADYRPPVLRHAHCASAA